MIELKSVAKVYESGGQKVNALNGIDLTIKKEKFMGLLDLVGRGKAH